MSGVASPSSENNHKVAVPKTSTKNLYSLTLRHYIILAVIVLLSFSRMVRPQEFAFVVFTIIYMYFLSMVAFPVIPNVSYPPILTSKQLKFMGFYIIVTGIIGLVVPIAYVTEGFFFGHKESIKPAVPHLFLLLCQVFMEGVGFSDKFSLPIRVYVPVVYNSVRISTLIEWLRDEFSMEYGGGDFASSSSAIRIYAGRSIVVANMVLWCFNLFGFLLPVWLPKIFKLYYSSPAALHKVKT
ncbi:hypothetical protein DCAR_0311723 [Daucus carota subsp. sativus]|uniref:DUF7733 domain-containing protein n=1 Tax=Daucus carota subsp. sativus TaxID=79200 RepID=A0A162AIG3_DAUCS|nr:PREDICTED: uncharacterized protein LOC108211756 [Daucus carota subsp. sativus]XP_017238927.1 PREDICTED: uncharacterized protein LOC108211758 [Daucus carota subsp. sativus]WOG92454.1 hypothetical protein DCAR_0311723 [Daucus carota subsp. sativus]